MAYFEELNASDLITQKIWDAQVRTICNRIQELVSAKELVFDAFDRHGYDRSYIYQHLHEFHVRVFSHFDGGSSTEYYHEDELLFTVNSYINFEGETTMNVIVEVIDK